MDGQIDIPPEIIINMIGLLVTYSFFLTKKKVKQKVLTLDNTKGEVHF